jgi:hypothetical protein
MKKLLLVLFVTIFIATPIFSQISFGVKAAVSDFSYWGSDWDLIVDAFPNMKNDPTAGHSAGILFEIPLARQFFIQPEVKHTVVEIGVRENNYWTKEIYGFIEIPVYIKFALPATTGSFYFMAGPVVFRGHKDFRWEDSDLDSGIYSYTDFDTDTLLGFSVAAGFEKYMDFGALLVGLMYTRELTKMDYALE